MPKNEPRKIQEYVPRHVLRAYRSAQQQIDAQKRPLIEANRSGITLGLFGFVGGEKFNLLTVRGVLRKNPRSKVLMEINSPGGLVSEGMGIYNLLRQHRGEVTAHVLGVAGSSAQFVSMGADKVLMGEGSQQFIHNSSIIIIGGNKYALRKVIDMMQQNDEAIASIIASRSGIPVDKVSHFMDEETTFSAARAIKLGLAEGMIPAKKRGQKSRAQNVRNAATLHAILKIRTATRRLEAA